jgi:lipoate-protein ligase A
LEWRLIEDGAADGYRNMALDEALLESCAAGSAGFPALRLYAFAPPCLSIGFSQAHERVVDLDFCRSRGIDVVRRPTGGRAVLHDDEITYTVVALAGRPPFDGSVLDVYGTVSRALIAGFEIVGLAAAVSASVRATGSPREGAVCFAEPSRHEIGVSGFKIAGSAPARRRGAFLQHGSIPISHDMETLARATAGRDGPSSGTTAATLPAMKGIAQILGAPVTREDLAVAIGRGFEAALGANLRSGATSPAERERAEVLRAERYLTTAWTFRR